MQSRLSSLRRPRRVPPHVLSRDIVKEYFGRVFGISGRRLDAILEVVDNSRIDRRYSIFPVDYLIEPRPLAQINREYRDHAIALTRCAAQRGARPRGHRRRRCGPDRYGFLHRRHDSLAGRLSSAGIGLSPERAPPAHHRTRLRRGRRGPDACLGIFARVSASHRAPDRRRAALADVPARGPFPGESDLDDSVWRRRGRGGDHGTPGAGPPFSTARAICFPTPSTPWVSTCATTASTSCFPKKCPS